MTNATPLPVAVPAQGRQYMGLTGYQWLVLAAAWLGWGFDVFDGLLFNYVATPCITDLFHLTPGLPETKQTVLFWNGVLTSVLLVGWGVGGILFGKISDRLGRSKTLLITMLVYSLATAGCAFATNIWMLVFFRVISSLGIGGEWAAGASLVAETVPERKRVWAGMLLYTASPFGIALATLVTKFFQTELPLTVNNPSLAWRAVFLTGLIPAVVAMLIRIKVKEPQGWKPHAEGGRVRDLFSPSLRRKTLGGLAMAVIALLSWWSCFAFLPTLAAHLAAGDEALSSHFRSIGTYAYSIGGLVGTLFTLPAAMYLGRRWMFLIYFSISALAVWTAFGADISSSARMYMMFPVGVGVFGVFGSFTFYLPELFPMRLRCTGAGFCYNTGRFVAAAGPFIVGIVAQKETADLLRALSWVAVFPALGVVFVLVGLGEETKGKALADHE